MMLSCEVIAYTKLWSHTILLVQPGKPETRTYTDYESVNECMEGVCHIYEEHLKRQNPNTPSITYDISQLFDFVDQLVDLSCLVYQKSTNTYCTVQQSMDQGEDLHPVAETGIEEPVVSVSRSFLGCVIQPQQNHPSVAAPLKRDGRYCCPE
ncbi:hypothetical protein HPB50_001410 [Hyalomma asiaticum]|uniref:Uncharacterized protein n=1 Tax=Hyalomma asiaticum TaxID=266040 RepID=A0ACB7RTJ6_HYAAI|nr:hypothetical protein HPB50_001410 [Hyalomma asiaticum]